MKFYVYSHINPETKRPFYIGKGCGSRCYEHRSRNSSWKAYVEFLNRKGTTFGVEILHNCESEQKALELESFEIRRLLSEGHKILNRSSTAPTEKTPNVILDIPEAVLSDPIALFVRHRRKKAKLTQVMMAKKAGVGLRFVRELERGKSALRTDVVNKVLHLFGAELGPIKVNVLD